MSKCDRIEDYFAMVLSGKERQTFQVHLSGCPTCRERLNQLRHLDNELRASMPRVRTVRRPNRPNGLMTPVWQLS